MKFSEIPGQRKTANGLINMVKNNRLPHAMLFSGSEGVGKLALAVALARYVHCSNPGPDDACGVCPSCSQISNLAHPDLHFVYPIAKIESSKIKVSEDIITEWRELFLENPFFTLADWMDKIKLENQQPGILVDEAKVIVNKLSMKSYSADYKIMIIWLPERMHISCSNKILKIIEEPYPKTLIIMVSENPEKLLPTIISRLQPVKIPKIQNEALKQALIEKFSLDAVRAADVATISDGSMAKAKQVIEESDIQKINFHLFVNLMRLAYKKDIFGINKWVEEIAGLGREKQKTYLVYMMRMIRENFIKNMNEPDINFLTAEEKEFSEKFSPFIHKNNVFGIYEETGKAHYHIERNGSAKIVFFDFAIKMILLIKG